MTLRTIPNPVLTPFTRKKESAKAQVPVSIPKPEKTPTPPVAAKPKKQEASKKPVNVAAPPAEPVTTTPPPQTPEGEEPLAVLADGTTIPKPYKSVDPLTAVSSSNPALTLLLMRQMKDMQGPMPDSSKGALGLLNRLESAIREGKDISALREEVSVMLMGGEERDELFLRMVAEVDRERAEAMITSRSKFEDLCHGASRRGDLNIVEGMAAVSYFNAHIPGLIARIEKKHQSSDGGNTRDTDELLNRVNRPTRLQNKELETKFDAASPQEREIIRKLGFKFQSALAARITTTTQTQTQTVEVVQTGTGDEKPIK